LTYLIYAIDRELIYPVSFEATIPPYMNHIQHTFPLISVLLDMLLIDHSYHSSTLRLDLAMVCAVSITYVGVLVFVWVNEGIWVYPFIGLLPDLAKVAFFAFGVFLVALVYYGGMITSGTLWRETKRVVKIKKVK
jgi:FAR-17a/AIG1-like protein